MARLFDAISQCASLRSLDVSHNAIKRKAAEALGRALAMPTCSILELDISCCEISSKAAELIADGLSRRKVIESLAAGGNDFADAGAVSFFTALSACPQLRSVDFEDSALTVNCMDSLAIMIQTCQIAELDLSDNQLNSNAIAPLFAALSRQPRYILELRLGENLISTPACADMLEVCTGLTELDLSENLIDQSGAHALAMILSDHPSIETLDLTGNSIESGGLLALVLAFVANKESAKTLLLPEPDEDDFSGSVIDLAGRAIHGTEKSIEMR